MSLTSLTFAGATAAAAAVFHLLPRRWQSGWLLLVSYGIYALWDWRLPILLAALTLVTYWAGGKRPWPLWAGLGLNLALVVGVKYAWPANPAPAGGFASPLLAMLIPLGSSYRLLENISYLIDRRFGQIEPARLFDLALYSAYFPKLIAGPIERATDLLPRLAEPRVVDNAVLARVLTFMVIGLVRKLVIADQLTRLIPPAAFSAPLTLAAPALLAALGGYLLALYNDFAGYTDIVRGVSLLFGIELSANFDAPFFSHSVTEIWRRWHSTLTFWLRDYIYLPVSRWLLRRFRDARHPLNVLGPPLAAMLVSALWHELAGHMLVWGALFGLALAAERLAALRRTARPGPARGWRRLAPAAGTLWTLTLFAAAIIPFRMTLPVALQFVRGLTNWSGGLSVSVAGAALAAVSFGLDAVQHSAGDELVFLQRPRWLQALLLALAVLAVFLATRIQPAAPFIYQGF